jgi:hypothetical protein
MCRSGDKCSDPFWQTGGVRALITLKAPAVKDFSEADGRSCKGDPERINILTALKHEGLMIPGEKSPCLWNQIHPFSAVIIIPFVLGSFLRTRIPDAPLVARRLIGFNLIFLSPGWLSGASGDWA